MGNLGGPMLLETPSSTSPPARPRHTSTNMLLPLPLSSDRRSFVPHEAPVLIDLRPRLRFLESHLVGSASIPLSTLRERLFELPPPGEWLLTLFGSQEELAEASCLLAPKGWTPRHLDAGNLDVWRSHPTEAGPSSMCSWRPNSFLYASLRALRLNHETSSGLALDLGCG